MRLDPFRLERYFAKHEFSAPYLLCSSDCESMELRDLLALEPGAQELLASLWLGYTESLGDPELRQAITTLYQHVVADQVLVHAGAEEAIFNFMNVALKHGDHVIVHAPYYQSLGEVARSIGAGVSEWRGDPERAWELDLGVLESALTARTKVVVVNFPHNPTGFLPTPEFVHELSALSDRHSEVIVERNLQIIRDNLDRLDHFFGAHAELFGWYRPRAGSIAFPMLLRGRVDEFCADLVEEAGVLLLPGTLYGDRFNSFRVGFGRKNLPESLERFEEYIREAR